MGLFQLIDQLTLADAPENLVLSGLGLPAIVRTFLKPIIDDLAWADGARQTIPRGIYIDNLNSEFGSDYDGITNLSFYGIPPATLGANHSFGYEWYFGIGNQGLTGTLLSPPQPVCPGLTFRYGALLSNVLSSGVCQPPANLATLRNAFKDPPDAVDGGRMTELGMYDRTRPYNLDFGAPYSSSQLGHTITLVNNVGFFLQSALNSLMNISWQTFMGGKISFRDAQASGITASPVLLTTPITLPADILYMTFTVARSTGLPSDVLGVFFDATPLAQLSGAAFGASTQTITLGPIDLSDRAGQTGALTLVYDSTQTGITVTFANLSFAQGMVQPAKPNGQFAAATISNIRAYPNPWRPGSGGGADSANVAGCGTGIIFDKLTSAATIRIYSVRGELVREIAVSAADTGCKAWDGRDSQGRSVASGVYTAVVKSSTGEKAVKHIAIER